MRCQHCGGVLTEEEQAANAQTVAIHGFDLGLCRLCWDAWGTMTYGWQAGVPEDQRVRFIDRADAWDARRPT